MSENTTNPNENDEVKKVNAEDAKGKKEATPKQNKKNEDKGSFSDTVSDYRAEFKKIVWPSREELVKKTATVIVTSLLVGVVIFAMDSAFSAGQSFLIGLLG